MTSYGPTLRAILRINIQVVMAIALGFTARVMWTHADIEWWGFWPIAMMCGLASAAGIVGTIGEIKTIILRDREVWRYKRQGGAPKSDRLVSPDALREKGLIE